MFDFNFNNPLGFLIAFIPALLNIAIVCYIYWKLPENRLTNVFALLTFTLACWQINDSITRISVSAQLTDTWDTIFCAAWIFVSPLCLHFALLYSSRLKQERSRTAIMLLYIPALVFMLFYQAHVYTHFYSYDKVWGWVNYHDKHWLDVGLIYWMSALVIAATVIIFYHAYTIRKDVLLKKQTIIIATGIAIPTITGIAGQVIMPVILNMPAIPFASTFMTFFSLATVLSLNRYRLFNAADMVNNERLIEDMPLMIFSISERKRLTYINKYAAEALAINRKELGLQPLSKLLLFGSMEHGNLFFEAYHNSLKGASINNIETSFISASGKIDVILSCKPIVNNKLVHGVLFAARDITPLKQSNDLLIHKEMLLADAQQISHIGSWEWNIRSNSIMWSDELFRIYGYEPRETNINFKQFVEWLHPDDKNMVEGIIMDAFTTHVPFNFNARVIKKDKSVVSIHAHGKVIANESNETVIMSGTVQDITEQKEKEETLQRQNEELKKINHELDTFVYSVSHDLRAPLLSMQGVVDITADVTTEELTAEHMGMLKTSITRMDNFIEDILDYSRNARGKLKINPIDFNELIKAITDDLKYMANESRFVDIQFSITTEGTFCTDKGRMSVLLNNLISNAIRYHNPDAEKSYVKITVNANEVNTIIEVEDNGIGISEENHQKIFDMFYRVSENSNGSGLGLYIVSETVEKLQGKISVESQPGIGTKFHLDIPNLFYQ